MVWTDEQRQYFREMRERQERRDMYRRPKPPEGCKRERFTVTSQRIAVDSKRCRRCGIIVTIAYGSMGHGSRDIGYNYGRYERVRPGQGHVAVHDGGWVWPHVKGDLILHDEARCMRYKAKPPCK